MHYIAVNLTSKQDASVKLVIKVTFSLPRLNCVNQNKTKVNQLLM